MTKLTYIQAHVTSDEKMEGFVWLQGIGHVQAKPVAELVPNVDYILFNYGSSALFTGHMLGAKGQIVGYKVRTAEGKTYETKRRAATLVPYATERP